ncbi:MAG: hypothetical protein GY711_15100 [bacterium]|nr:hypothetical protein [bacterium]
MPFHSFVDENKISRTELSHVTRRHFFVAPVHHGLKSQKHDGPYVATFTNRPLTDSYAELFDAVQPLGYGSFVDVFQPHVGYRIVGDGPFPAVQSVIPRSSSDVLKGDVLHPEHLLMHEATASCQQPAFAQSTQAVLGDNPDERGRRIFLQLRKDLRTIALFSSRAEAIPEVFSEVLDECALQHGLPTFAHGAPLPDGLRQELMHLLIHERGDRPAKLRKVLEETTGDWRALARDKEKRKVLEQVVSEFRDQIVRRRGGQTNHLQFRGKLLRRLIAEKLQARADVVVAFRDGRQALHRVQQTLRNKVLASMPLQWLLSAYYKVPIVDELPSDDMAARDAAVGRAICDGMEGVVAEPIERLGPEAKEQFVQDLEGAFDQLLDLLLATHEEGAAESLIEELPEELRAVARELLTAPRIAAALMLASGQVSTSARQRGLAREAFRIACKSAIRDVLCPALFREAVLSPAALRKELTRDVLANFLSSVLFQGSGELDLTDLADRYIAAIETARPTGDFRQVKADLVHEFLNLLSVESEGLQGNVVALGRILEPLYSARLERKYVSRMIPSARRANGHPRALTHDQPKSIVSAVAHHRVQQDVTRLSQGDEDVGPSSPDGTWDEQARAKIAAKMPPGESAEEVSTELVTDVVRDLLKSETFTTHLREDLELHERTLHQIYARYEKSAGRPEFASRVEKMTLELIMLENERELGLGLMCTNLYQLLIDMVEHLDPERPDLERFIRTVSLTRYFDADSLRGNGVTQLRKTLELQTIESFGNIVNFVSEIRGFEYMLEALQVSAGRDDAEVIVVNATADEFLHWLRTDNLVENKGRGLLRAGKLVEPYADSSCHPSLVFMTPSAFPEGDQAAWLEKLAAFRLRETFGMVMPPISLSTTTTQLGEGGEPMWQREGREWMQIAEGCPCPVLVLGPSPHLNDPAGSFPTLLPAGYLLAVHLLGRSPKQDVHEANVAPLSAGSFQGILSGFAPLRESLERVVVGKADTCYSFAASYYLHFLLLVLATAKGRQSARQVDGRKLLQACVQNIHTERFRSCADQFKDLLIEGERLLFALGQEASATTPLRSVRVTQRKSEETSESFDVDNVEFFNATVEQLQLLPPTESA